MIFNRTLQHSLNPDCHYLKKILCFNCYQPLSPHHFYTYQTIFGKIWWDPLPLKCCGTSQLLTKINLTFQIKLLDLTNFPVVGNNLQPLPLREYPTFLWKFLFCNVCPIALVKIFENLYKRFLCNYLKVQIKANIRNAKFLIKYLNFSPISSFRTSLQFFKLINLGSIKTGRMQ